VPASESKGLLLLTPDDVQQLSRDRLTLKQFLQQGGRAVLRERLPEEMLLEPGVQLMVLARLLEWHPGLALVERR
jgi:hypothetical protein